MMRSLDNLDAGAVKACQSFQTLLKDDILGATLTVREAFAELNKNRCLYIYIYTLYIYMFSNNTDGHPVQSFAPEALEFSAAMRLRALSVVPSLALMCTLCEGDIAEMCRR